jgi:hypothetical protein
VDEDENQFLTVHFSWEAVKSHFDDVISFSSNENLEEMTATSAEDGGFIAPQKPRNQVNPLSIAILFVRNIKEKVNSRRNSFRDELLANKRAMEAKMTQNFMTSPAVDPEIMEGEHLVAKMLAKEVSHSHSYLPASLPNALDE